MEQQPNNVVIMEPAQIQQLIAGCTAQVGLAMDERVNQIRQEVQQGEIRLQQLRQDIQQQAAAGQQNAAAGAAAAAAQPAPPQRTKLDKYQSADQVEWTIWRRHFGIVADINGWNAQRRRQEIAAAMGGTAAQYVQDIPLNEGPDPNNANGLLDAYEARFVPQAASDIARDNFKKAKQDEAEDITKWHSRLRHLYQRAYPNMPAQDVLASRDLIDAFVYGLADAQVRARTADKAPEDYNGALTTASNMTAVERRLNANFDQPQIKQEQINAMSDTSRIVCHHCKKRGHMKRDCRQLARQNRKDPKERQTRPWFNKNQQKGDKNERFRKKNSGTRPDFKNKKSYDKLRRISAIDADRIKEERDNSHDESDDEKSNQGN